MQFGRKQNKLILNWHRRVFYGMFWFINLKVGEVELDASKCFMLVLQKNTHNCQKKGAHKSTDLMKWMEGSRKDQQQIIAGNGVKKNEDEGCQMWMEAP